MMKSVKWGSNSFVVEYEIKTGEIVQGYFRSIPECMEIDNCIYTLDYYNSCESNDKVFENIDPLEDQFEENTELTEVEKGILYKELFGSDGESDSDSDDEM